MVLSEPPLQVGLEFLQAGRNFLPEHNVVELIEHGLVEAFTAPVGLGAFHLGPGMVEVLHRHIQLLLMARGGPAGLRAPIS